MILGKAPKSRRKAAIHAEHLPQQPPVSPPVVNQQHWVEPQPDSSSPPSPTETSSPAVSSVEYNSQLVTAEQTVTTELPSAHAGGSTATHSASNPVTTPISTLFVPVGEDYVATVSGDTLVQVGSSGSTHYSSSSKAQIEAMFNSLFTSPPF